MSLIAALTPVVEALEALGIAYQIGGSVASSNHGAPRSTNDVDLVADIHEEHIVPLCRALRGEYYAEEELLRLAVRQRTCTNFLHLPTAYKVDLFVRGDSDYDRCALQRVVAQTLAADPHGRTFLLATAEDILLRKLLWFRASDETSDRQWNDVLGVLRLQAGKLDRTYLDRWANELGLGQLLARAERNATQ